MINLNIKNKFLTNSLTNKSSLTTNNEANEQEINSLNNLPIPYTQNLSIIDIENDLNLSHQYADICRQFSLENKWILMINPDEQPLELLSKNSDINTSRVLKVHANKVKVVLKNIEKALTKGNCAVVVLCNPILNDDEIAQLNRYVNLGKTSCIVIRNNRQVH